MYCSLRRRASSSPLGCSPSWPSRLKVNSPPKGPYPFTQRLLRPAASSQSPKGSSLIEETRTAEVVAFLFLYWYCLSLNGLGSTWSFGQHFRYRPWDLTHFDLVDLVKVRRSLTLGVEPFDDELFWVILTSGTEPFPCKCFLGSWDFWIWTFFICLFYEEKWSFLLFLSRLGHAFA